MKIQWKTPRRLLTISMTLLMALGLSVSLWLVLGACHDAQAQNRRSAISRIRLNRPNIYLPTRLVIGEDNRFIVKAPAGNMVVLLLSPEPGGYRAPDGTVLPVGTEHQRLEALASEKGVAVFNVPIPEKPELIGRMVFVAGYTYGSPDYSDLVALELLDSIGQPSSHNQLAIDQRSNGEGAMVMPGMPGMGTQMLRRLSTLGDVAGDERKKDLVDDGSRSGNVLMDQNTFITRPDGTGGLGGSSSGL